MSYHLHDIALSRNGETYLEGINLKLPEAGVVTLVGRTLAGKTSLLRLLAGLVSPSAGRLTKSGQDMLALPPWKRRVGMVYQQFVNYPHLSVRDNIVFPLERARASADLINQRLDYVVELLGLTEFLQRRPQTLSGGQQQRVALARALVKDAELLLLDEPLVNLDYKLREQLREEFRRIFRGQEQRLVIYATTEPSEAMVLQGQVVVLHEGRALQMGDYRDVYHRPANAIVAQVFNDPPMNLLDGEIVQGELRIGRQLHVRVPAHMSGLADGRYIFGLRAADFTLGDPHLHGALKLVEINGSSTIVHLDMDGLAVVLQEDGVHHLKSGEPVPFRPKLEQLFAFSNATSELIAAPAARDAWGG